MSMLTQQALPRIDATTQDCITDEQAALFRDNGLILIGNLLSPSELSSLQNATLPLYLRAVNERPDDPDYAYARHEVTGEMTPYRIEYMIDKDPSGACKRLLAHPFVLRSIEKLQGRNFIPTWDSMVFKKQGMGKAIPWHRDAAAYDSSNVDNTAAAINVDFYLDGSDTTNCLWGILGSNRWSESDAQATIRRLNDAPGMFSSDAGCVPIPVEPGDVLFHSVLVLHGSPAARSAMRRVLYYEFRPGEVELAYGPHTPEYVPLKQRVLHACIRERATAPYAQHEMPFTYRPTGQFQVGSPHTHDNPATFRHAHGDYWRQQL